MSILYGLFGSPNIEKLQAKHDIRGLINLLSYRKDDSIRKSAAQALESLGWKPESNEAGAAYWVAKHQWRESVALGSSAVDPLLLALRDKDRSVRLAVINALGEIRDERAIKPLITALTETDDEICGSAIQALVQIGTKAIPDLVVALKVQSQQAQAKAGKPFNEFSAHLMNKVPIADLHCSAADVLVKIGEPVVGPLIDALKTEDLVLQRVIAQSLGKIGDQQATKPLQDLIERVSPIAGSMSLPADSDLRALALIMVTVVGKALSQIENPEQATSVEQVSKPAMPEKDEKKILFPRYSGSGVCDVCNASVASGEAFCVPVNVFYGSRKYKEWLKVGPLSSMIRMAGGVETYISTMKTMDSTDSAVCPKCIHLFED
jgi:hypothetical protein